MPPTLPEGWSYVLSKHRTPTAVSYSLAYRQNGQLCTVLRHNRISGYKNCPHQCGQITKHLVLVHQHLNNIFFGSCWNESKAILSRVFNQSKAIIGRQLLKKKRKQEIKQMLVFKISLKVTVSFFLKSGKYLKVISTYSNAIIKNNISHIPFLFIDFTPLITAHTSDS